VNCGQLIIEIFFNLRLFIKDVRVLGGGRSSVLDSPYNIFSPYKISGGGGQNPEKFWTSFINSPFDKISCISP
jgi:hypothetical protein